MEVGNGCRRFVVGQHRTIFRSKQDVMDRWYDNRGRWLWFYVGLYSLSRLWAALVLEGTNLFRNLSAAVHGAELPELQSPPDRYRKINEKTPEL